VFTRLATCSSRALRPSGMDTYILLYMSLGVVDLATAFLALDVRQRDFELEVRYCVWGVISPLLANIALHVLDVEWEKAGRRLGVLIRYADDSSSCAPPRPEPKSPGPGGSGAGQPGFAAQPGQDRIVRLTKGEQGFDFLGFHHRKVEAWRWPGRFYMQRWPSKRAMASIKDKARQATDRRFVGIRWRRRLQRLNPVLRGWGNYFRVGNSARKFSTVDSYVHMRLARLASTKYGLSHRNWARTKPLQPGVAGELEVYRLTGTVRWKTAHAVR